MSNHEEEVTLANIANGALASLFSEELNKVLDDIWTLDKVWTDQRTIKISLDFKPVARTRIVNITASIETVFGRMGEAAQKRAAWTSITGRNVMPVRHRGKSKTEAIVGDMTIIKEDGIVKAYVRPDINQQKLPFEEMISAGQ